MRPVQGEQGIRVRPLLAAPHHAGRQGIVPPFFRVGNFGDKAEAEVAYRAIPSGSVAEITKAERREVQQQPPLLYDLTALQKDCNVHLDLPAAKTLDIAQTLYEKKLISYPRTGSRHIPQDVMAHVPGLLEKISAMPNSGNTGRRSTSPS